VDADCGGASCGLGYANGVSYFSDGFSLFATFIHGPWLCAPGQHLAQPGAPCASDADCSSNLCRGSARQQCSDGRACATDSNCPEDPPPWGPGKCITVGVQGGICR
jgi:hypothetical protein